MKIGKNYYSVIKHDSVFTFWVGEYVRIRIFSIFCIDKVGRFNEVQMNSELQKGRVSIESLDCLRNTSRCLSLGQNCLLQKIHIKNRKEYFE